VDSELPTAYITVTLGGAALVEDLWVIFFQACTWTRTDSVLYV